MIARLVKILRGITPEFIQSPVRTYFRNVRARNYEGDSVECNICGSKYRVFAPHGLAHRPNAKCLNCGSLERHRLMWRYINECTDFRNRESVRLLHFAPEKVFLGLFGKLNLAEYVPCDLDPERYQINAVGFKIARVDITAIPFPDNHFDVILCSHVLEHIPDDHLAMTELRRVMKPDGWGIFQVPIDYARAATYEDASITDPQAREKHFGQSDHVRYYGRDYVNRLERAGLNVVSDDFVKRISEEECFKYGFDRLELVYFCKKK